MAASGHFSLVLFILLLKQLYSRVKIAFKLSLFSDSIDCQFLLACSAAALWLFRLLDYS